MAESAWVFVDLQCPECREILTDVVWFAWGGMLSTNIHNGPMYSLGDRLVWFSDARGKVHADSRLPFTRGVNLGDPRALNVDVYEINGVPRKCPACGLSLYGSCVEITNGVIHRVRAIPEGEHDDNIHAVEIDPKSGESKRYFELKRPVGVMPWPG